MSSTQNYATITGAYWIFTLTDGALRMLVLLFLHQQGFLPLEIAGLFLSYEFFGVLTNFSGGLIAARFGLKLTLVSGLMLQIAALGLLASQTDVLGLQVLLLAQALGGVAKDLTKMSAKSYLKFLVPADDGLGLMRWVALLTGSKNTLKGCGFFMGGALLQFFEFDEACKLMMAALCVALLGALFGLPRRLGKSKQRVSLASMFTREGRINWLSAARFFLFGARDAWFVLALPIFLASQWGWSHGQVGAFLALWIITYGVIQAMAPKFVGGTKSDSAPRAKHLGLWTLALSLPLVGTALGLGNDPDLKAGLILGLFVFAVVFAACSAIHSYLILAYAKGEEVNQRVGFYYMANAAGRLMGTFISGAVFQAAGQGAGGLAACLWVATALSLVAAAACVPLARSERQSSSA